MSKANREWARIRPEEQAIVARHMSTVPVRLGALANELGIRVSVSSLPINISGQISRDKDGYEIKINRHESRERQRFTLAHEISHYLLHRHVIDSLGGTLKDNVLYRSNASEQIEYEANRLAAFIVMPESELQKAWARFGDQLSESAVEHLAEEFGVSKAAMEIRLAA